MNLYTDETLHEKCAVFGIYGSNTAASLVNLGLWALQHRGQEGTGICSSDSKQLFTYKGEGLVADVYTKESLLRLKGSMAIGHNRYSTSGGSINTHTQPIIDEDGLFTLVHNGNLPSTKSLAAFLQDKGIDTRGRNDSELMYDAIKYYIVKGIPVVDAVKKCFPLFTGAFALLIMTKDKMIALRDEFGIRPLCIGKLDAGYVFSSESCGLDIINAPMLRDVMPGEMVVIDETGLHSYQIKQGISKLDIFEMIYFARPDSILLGKRVNEVRRNLGLELAKEYKIKADVVIPVPDSAIPVALGYAEGSGIKFDHGIIKNRYIHRTFIEPSQEKRLDKVKIKYNPLKEVIAGKDIIVIDDSIVRGTTVKELVKMLKNAGANKVYLLSACPPILYPDFYGIDTPIQEDLISATLSIPEMIKYIGADDIKFISYDGMIRATQLPEDMFCTSCFTGIYPIDIGNRKEEVTILDQSVIRKGNKYI